jgi:hypothetical protein
MIIKFKNVLATFSLDICGVNLVSPNMYVINKRAFGLSSLWGLKIYTMSDRMHEAAIP